MAKRMASWMRRSGSFSSRSPTFTNPRDTIHGGGDDTLTPPRLLVPRRQRALAKQVEFVFVEAALEPEQQTIIALPGRV
ncbi:hypothetical protein, partial [Roseospira visakhapatnamensis]|uniref:hypothetical protein n=1 Tax=Roseospira visakhapatnamensis TaxID=390880 RepID=UPI001FE93DE6